MIFEYMFYMFSSFISVKRLTVLFTFLGLPNPNQTCPVALTKLCWNARESVGVYISCKRVLLMVLWRVNLVPIFGVIDLELGRRVQVSHVRVCAIFPPMYESVLFPFSLSFFSECRHIEDERGRYSEVH